MSALRNYVDKTENFTKRDQVNAKNGFAFKDLESPCEIVIVGAAQAEDTDEETGEIVHVSVLKTENADYYTGISDSVYDTVEMLIEIINEEGPTTVRINTRKSKAGRDFLTMTVL